MEDLKIKEGDIGLFEFQIKRGVVDENEIEDEDDPVTGPFGSADAVCRQLRTDVSCFR